ncbi:MAG TPA: alanine racemase [Thermoanaerobaculia bacterium]|nr:alanine racemase [Thermoanaerobaculia bacterium]
MTTIGTDVLLAGLASAEPAYVYDLDRLRQRCRRLIELPFPRKRIFFATMANDHPEILACIRREHIGAFVNSESHLRLVLDAGFAPANVVYAASNMTAGEMASCVALGVNLVLDSLGQLETLASLRVRALDVGLRVNAGSALDKREVRHDPSYRFGVLEEELPAAIALAARHGIRIAGAHSYFGTDIRDPHILLDGLERLARVASTLPDLCYLDVGGGFGVPDADGEPEFDLQGYGRSAAALLRSIEERLGRSLEIYVEPGRYLVSDCGFFFVKVVDRKIRADRVFVGTNGSVAGFPRPLIYPDIARHPCSIAGAEPREPYPLPLWICGNSTYSQDFLARGIELSLPECGETLVFRNAGAYGRSMLTRFLGKNTPAELVIDSEARQTSVSSALAIAG